MIELQVVSDTFNRKNLHFDHVTNNLANAGTVGFKAERLFFEVGPAVSSGEAISSYEYTPQVKIDFTEGFLEKTGNPLDLAIEGKGFFTIETPDGAVYTRKGNFTVNSTGEIVTQGGHPVSGASGPIVIQGSDVQVEPDGTVTVDGAEAGKLKIMSFRNPEALERSSNGCFRDAGDAGAETSGTAAVRAGFLEKSNVNAIKEMIDMIDIQRSLECYQKVIQTLSDQDKMSTSRIGRLI